ncbi:MAG: PTS galactitol transporter subunit IIC [Lachnospiraceae bacterium]|nr:PTS galactitol transporter subunit IIC [Lachnospiraceae bacterium]
MNTFLKGCAFVINYVIDMGASVMLPIIIAILAIIIGVKVGKAIRSGLMIGVGFVGMGLIVGMMNTNMGPAAKAMAHRLGVSLQYVEVGWPGMSGVTWGSIIATIAIPLSIVINLIMFALKATKTINIDIWNVWHMAFTGAIAYAVTGNIWIGILGAAIHAVITFKFGDLWAPLLADYFELDGLTTPHGTSAYMAPIACFVDTVIDKIPGVRKIKFSVDGLQEKIGVIGEPVVIGGLLGAIIGFLAGYGPQKALPLGINMAAVMVLMPKVIKCIMEGLMPISERAKEIMHKHFGEDADFFIGLDPAILLGDPGVVTAGIFFIPITLLLAIIIPGNRVLPFGDLATIGFFIAIAVAVHKGNLFRTLISGSCIMAMTIWITNQTVGWTTTLGKSVGAVKAGQHLTAMDQGGCPITYIFTQLFTRSNVLGLIVIAAIYLVCMVFAVRVSHKRAAELKARKALEEAE